MFPKTAELRKMTPAEVQSHYRVAFHAWENQFPAGGKAAVTRIEKVAAERDIPLSVNVPVWK